MDAMITAAGRALARGDVLGALKRVALRDDAPALALRGIAMARLGDFGRAKALLQSASNRFGSEQAIARARCSVALAEIALVSRDLGWPAKALEAARQVLETHKDYLNSTHALLIQARRSVLVGNMDDAEQVMARIDPSPLASALRAAYELTMAGMAIRRIRASVAEDALARAKIAAKKAGIDALAVEIEEASLELETPAARLVSSNSERQLTLAKVENLLNSDRLIVDACRHTVRHGNTVISLSSRPVLFALAQTLAEAWPLDASRRTLVARVFRGKDADDSYRARLRVEISRLRKALRPLASVMATGDGFTLVTQYPDGVVVLLPPFEGENAALLSLLSDGAAWSSSALALALGASQRTVQRGLDLLTSAGKVQAFGHGPARRWTAPPLAGITTTLLLPLSPPSG